MSMNGKGSHCGDVKLFYVIKGDEFNSKALSNLVVSFFHIFVIVLLVECEKI